MSKIRIILNKLKANFILTALIPIILIAPDFLAKIFTDHNQASLSGKFIIGLIVFSLFLSFTRKTISFLILGLFIVIELIQFIHLFYYGSLITSSKLKLLFLDFDEVWQVAGEAVSFLYFVPFLIIIPYGILFYAYKKLEAKRYKSIWATIPVILALAVIPFRVNQAYCGVNYYPDPADHSLRNSLYACTNLALNLVIPNKKPTIKYEDYQVEEIETNINNVNVILIIGEGINSAHMSLFGYKRNTNPLLSTLKNDPNFTSLKGISSGVSTMVSMPLLINGIYEPNNYKALEDKKSNLFKLAKQHDFKTFYISAQTGALLANLSAEFIDYTIFRKKAPLLFNRLQDQGLLEIIPELDYSENNFIVINQRNAHAPYESNYQHDTSLNYFSVDSKNYQQFLIDTYDNAMLYNDYITYQLIDFYRNKFKGPTYIFYTSDHGEALGPNIYGHSQLDIEVASVPFMSYIINAKNEKIKSPICHYEVNNMVAKALGFNIINPNIKPNTCYIQGTDLYGINEYIEFKK